MASKDDLLMEVGDPGTATTLAAPGYTVGDTSINVGSTTNWPTATGVPFAIDEAEVVDGQEVQVAGTYNEYVATVSTGTSLTNVEWVRGVGDRDYAAGALTRVYIPVSAERENRIVEWGLIGHNQDGTHKAFTETSIVPTAAIQDSAITTAKLADGAVTNAKLSTATGELGGALQTWAPTLTGFSADPSGASYRYSKVGKSVTIYVSQPNNGTSNASNFTISLPFTAATITGFKWVVPVVQPINNGAVNTSTPGIASVDSAGTVVTLLRDLGGSTWTTSGGKRVPWFSLTYEAA